MASVRPASRPCSQSPRSSHYAMASAQARARPTPATHCTTRRISSWIGVVFAADALQRLADAAQRTALAGGDHAAARGALGHQRAGKDLRGIGAFVAGDGICRWHRLLDHRRGFAGEQRLVDREIRRFDELHVAGDAVAFGKQHDVVDHELASGDPARLPVAQHQRARARQVAQRLQRSFRAPLLDEGDAHHDKDEAEQHECFVAVAQHHVDGAAGHQQQEHRLGDHFAQQAQHAALFRHRQFVGAVQRETPARV